MNLEGKYQTPLAEVREYKPRIEKTLSGSIRLHRGHSLFKLSFITGILERVDLSTLIRRSQVPYVDKKKYMILSPQEPETIRYSMQKTADELVFPALNIKSAMKKLGKLGIKSFEKVV